VTPKQTRLEMALDIAFGIATCMLGAGIMYILVEFT